jgi:hypothetical protein
MNALSSILQHFSEREGKKKNTFRAPFILRENKPTFPCLLSPALCLSGA